MNCSILIATFGDEGWASLAQMRAYPSAIKQEPTETLMLHREEGTISTVRNELAHQAKGEWLCFLDADDELEDGYLDGMERALRKQPRDQPLLLTPAVSYVRNDKVQPPRFWPEIDIATGNWMVIGTLIERKFFHKIGGFRDWGDPPGSNAYEDWGLWATAIKAGARPVKAKRSVYIAYMTGSSRHRNRANRTKIAWHYEIGHALFPDLYPPDWMRGRR